MDNQGNFDHVIRPLAETEWNGIQPADCVFPAFLFIVGVAVAFALHDIWKRRRTKKQRGTNLSVYHLLLKLFTFFFISIL